MRGRHPEKKRGGKGISGRSSAGRGQDGAKRPHSRGRISKGRNFSKKNREGPPVSGRPEFQKNKRQPERKKGKKRVHSHQHQAAPRHEAGRDREQKSDAGLKTHQGKRDMKEFRSSREHGTQRERGIANKTKKKLNKGQKKNHDRKTSFGRSTSERKQQGGLKRRERSGLCAEKKTAESIAPSTGDGAEASEDGAEYGISISKKRKLDAENRRQIRNHDADYIKQCFRLYGKLLAAPRDAEGADSSTNTATEDADEAWAPQSNKEETSRVNSIRRSLAVQKAATALYTFVLPRVEENDQHLCTSRSIQALLKYGSDEQRKTLWNLLKDAFPELCSGRHSCQLATKLYLYGDSACQQEVVQMLRDPKTGKNIFFSKFGARVWEYVYTAAKSEKLQAQMLFSIMLPPLAIVRHPSDVETLPFPALFEKFDPETKKLTLDHLGAVVQSCVDKELLDRAPVHKLIHLYTMIAAPERLQDLMNVTMEGFLRLASTKSGVEAMVTLAGFATAKQRKHVIKEMKKHVISMAKNAVDCVFVLRLLCTVDDTRLLTEGIVQILLTDVKELVADPYGQLVLLQLLEDSGELSRYLPPTYKRLLEFSSPTSLKRADIRQNELRPPVLEAVETMFLQLAGGSAKDTHFSAADSSGEANDKEVPDQVIRAGQRQLRVPPKLEFTLSDWIADPKASRILTMLFRHSSSSAVFSALVAYFSRNQSATVAYVDRPQVQRFLSGLAKQMEPSSETASPAEDGLVVSDSNAVKEQVYGKFLEDFWRCILKPQLVPMLTTRGVFVVSDVLDAARRLALTNLENDVVGCLDPTVLSEARAKLMEEGSTSVGLDILAAKRVREAVKAQM